MAETIRIEIPIEAVDRTDPALSKIIRNFTKMETVADRAGAASQRAGGYRSLTGQRRKRSAPCPGG